MLTLNHCHKTLHTTVVLEDWAIGRICSSVSFPQRPKPIRYTLRKTFIPDRLRTAILLAIVYKNVSNKTEETGKRILAKQSVQKWLERSINDPIIKILSKHSNLTKIQLETLLIDFLAPNLAGKSLKNEEKALLRLSKAGISRGAFNRTLKQARRNVIESIYTILLLGYLGIFDDTRLDPYIEVAIKLREYVDAYQNVLSNDSLAAEHLRIMGMLREELETSVERLSNSKSLSKP